MPKLGNTTTTKFWLPTTKDEPNEDDRAYVELKNTLTMGDLLALNECKTDTERGIVLFGKIIKDWNFTEDGTPASPKLPINTENIDKLDPQDFVAISEWVNDNITDSLKGLNTEEKKRSSSTSIPVTDSPQPTI